VNEQTAVGQPPPPVGAVGRVLRSEDWWAVGMGLTLIVLAALDLVPAVPRPSGWSVSPLSSLGPHTTIGALLLMGGLGGLSALGVHVMGRDGARYLLGFAGVFLLALAAQVLGKQAWLKGAGLEYALWALLLGLAIANTVGTPAVLREGARSELFVKTGLVLMGGELLFQRILDLGAPGLVVAWVVTPTVIVTMWLLGTRVLRMGSKSLVMVIACATSVCGVSAAIAAAAACRAKKEELTLAVGTTLVFTVLMMVAMPFVARAMGLDDHVAGAWIGGTVDSTGAVVAAGSLFSEAAGQVAAVVKMIQNTLIGVVAFVIALYWVSSVERDVRAPRPSVGQVWHRFPKFVVGFVGASVLLSFVLLPAMGASAVDRMVGELVAPLRNWFFALAFVAIGLDSDFRQLGKQLAGGKPIALYATGQTFNIALTLLVAWLAFGP
jgi:uncharacterized integral membrane protein (TIGR00698 family)